VPRRNAAEAHDNSETLAARAKKNHHAGAGTGAIPAWQKFRVKNPHPQRRRFRPERAAPTQGFLRAVIIACSTLRILAVYCPGFRLTTQASVTIPAPRNPVRDASIPTVWWPPRRDVRGRYGSPPQP